MSEQEIIEKVLAYCPRSLDKRNGCGHWAVTSDESSGRKWEFQMRPTASTLRDIRSNCRVSCKRRAQGLEERREESLTDVLQWHETKFKTLGKV